MFAVFLCSSRQMSRVQASVRRTSGLKQLESGWRVSAARWIASQAFASDNYRENQRETIGKLSGIREENVKTCKEIQKDTEAIEQMQLLLHYWHFSLNSIMARSMAHYFRERCCLIKYSGLIALVFSL